MRRSDRRAPRRLDHLHDGGRRQDQAAPPRDRKVIREFDAPATRLSWALERHAIFWTAPGGTFGLCDIDSRTTVSWHVSGLPAGSDFPFAVTNVGDAVAIAVSRAITIFALPSGERLETFELEDAITALSFSSGGIELVAADADAHLHFCNRETRAVRTIRVPRPDRGLDRVPTTMLQARDREVAFVRGRELWTYDRSSDDRIRRFEPSIEEDDSLVRANRLDFSRGALSDQHAVAFVDSDEIVCLLNEHEVRTRAAGVQHVALYETVVATSDARGLVRLYYGHDEVSPPAGHDGPISSVLLPPGEDCFSRSVDGRLVRWSLTGGKHVIAFDAHRAPRLDAAPRLPVLRGVAWLEPDREAVFYRQSGGRRHLERRPSSHPVIIARSPSGELVVALEDGTVETWTEDLDVASSVKVETRPLALAFSSSGAIAIACTKSVTVFDPDGAPVRTIALEDRAPTHVALSPSGKLIAIASADSVSVHSLERDELAARFAARSVRDLAALASDRWLVRHGERGIRVLEPDGSSRPILTEESSRDPVTALGASPDGERFACGHASGAVTVWSLPR